MGRPIDVATLTDDIYYRVNTTLDVRTYVYCMRCTAYTYIDTDTDTDSRLCTCLMSTTTPTTIITITITITIITTILSDCSNSPCSILRLRKHYYLTDSHVQPSLSLSLSLSPSFCALKHRKSITLQHRHRDSSPFYSSSYIYKTPPTLCTSLEKYIHTSFQHPSFRRWFAYIRHPNSMELMYAGTLLYSTLLYSTDVACLSSRASAKPSTRCK